MVASLRVRIGSPSDVRRRRSNGSCSADRSCADNCGSINGPSGLPARNTSDADGRQWTPNSRLRAVDGQRDAAFLGPAEREHRCTRNSANAESNPSELFHRLSPLRENKAVWISCRLLLQRHSIQIKCEPRTSGIDYKAIVILMFGMAFAEVTASLARHSATSDQNVGFHQGCATIVADI